MAVLSIIDAEFASKIDRYIFLKPSRGFHISTDPRNFFIHFNGCSSVMLIGAELDVVSVPFHTDYQPCTHTSMVISSRSHLTLAAVISVTHHIIILYHIIRIKDYSVIS